MKIQKEHYYPILSTELIDIFTDKSFFENRLQSSGVADYEIEHFGERNGKFVIAFRRDIAIRPPAKLPGVVKKLIRDKNAIITNIQWDLRGDGQPSIGQYRFELEGLPGEVTGTTTVKSSGDGCVNQLDFTVSNSIPLIDKKLNSILGERLIKGLEKDHKSNLEYIQNFWSRERDDKNVV